MQFVTDVAIGSDELEGTVEYRVVGAVDGNRLTLRALPSKAWTLHGKRRKVARPPRGTAWSATVGGEDRSGGYYRDFAVSNLVAGSESRTSDLEIDDDTEFRMTAEVACGSERVLFEAAWRFGLREWGIKETFLEPIAMTPTLGGPLARELEQMQVPRAGERYLLDGELWVKLHVETERIDAGIALALTSIGIRPSRRLRRDPSHQLRTRQYGEAEGVSLSPYQLELVPPLDDSEATLGRVLAGSLDPLLAQQAAYLAGSLQHRALAPLLRECACDPREDSTVRINCLWALVQMRAEDARPWLATLVEDVPAARTAALAAWAQLDRAGLAAWHANRGATIEEAVDLFSAHPSLRFADRQIIESRDTIDVGSSGRDLIVCGNEAFVARYDTLAVTRGAEVAHIAIDQVERVAASADCSVVAALSQRGLSIFDAERSLRHFIAKKTGDATSISVSPDGRYVATSFDTVEVWEATSGKRVRVLHAAPAALAWNAAGLHAMDDGQLLQWTDIVRGKPKTLGSYGADRFALSPTDALIVVGAIDHEVIVWRGNERHVVEPVHEDIVLCVSFAPDGTCFATGDKGGTIAVWELGVAAPRRIFRTIDTRIFGVAFRGDRLLSTSIDEDVLSSWRLD